MREFLAAVAAVVVIGVLSAVVLEGLQQRSENAFSGAGTRIDPPGKPHS